MNRTGVNEQRASCSAEQRMTDLHDEHCVSLPRSVVVFPCDVAELEDQTVRDGVVRHRVQLRHRIVVVVDVAGFIVIDEVELDEPRF